MRIGQYGSEFDNSEGPMRQIQVEQNWLARLFHFKPATSYLCFEISRRRARQEISSLLRDWRKYGIRDIEVDKSRHIVFARVGAKNCELFLLVGKTSIPTFLFLFLFLFFLSLSSVRFFFFFFFSCSYSILSCEIK